jgi:hypothetical protein
MERQGKGGRRCRGGVAGEMEVVAAAAGRQVRSEVAVLAGTARSKEWGIGWRLLVLCERRRWE